MRQPVKRYVKVFINLSIAVAGILAVLWLAPKLIVYFMPFLIGWLLALIANPVVRFFEERLKIKRKAGSAIVIVAVIAAILALGYLLLSWLATQVTGFIEDLPNLLNAAEQDFDRVLNNLAALYEKLPGAGEEKFLSLGDKLNEYLSGMISRLEAPTMTAVGNLASKVPSLLVSTIMCLLSAYFFVADKDYMSQFVKKHVPLVLQEKGTLISSSLRHAVGGYFKAQFKIEIWIYLLLVAGLSLLKIEYAIIIALGIAILDFLPVFGTGAVLIPWAVIKILSADYQMALWLLVLWGGGQLVRQIIQPKIVGDSIGLAPLPTLFLLFIGYRLGSVVGMILAVPLGIILVNMDEEGLFNTAKDSIRILWYGLEKFRRLDREDMEPVEEEHRRLQRELEERRRREEAEREAEARRRAEEERRIRFLSFGEKDKK